LTKNRSQGSINQQIFPLIEERILSELPGPPLSADLINSLDCHELAGILGRFGGAHEIISVASPAMASLRLGRRCLDLRGERADAISL
jgi:hypothetical protein